MKNPLTIWFCEVVKKGGIWDQSECHEDRETKCGSLNEKGLKLGPQLVELFEKA